MSERQSREQLGKVRRASRAEDLEAAARVLDAQRQRDREAIGTWWNEWTKEHGYRDRYGRLHYTHKLLNHCVDIGLGTLTYLALHGDRDAARFLVEKGAGAPEVPLSVTVHRMTEQETVNEMREIARRRGATDLSIEGIIAMFSDPPALTAGEPDDPR